MGDRKRITTITKERVGLARLIFIDALSNDGKICGPEVPACLNALEDCYQASEAADIAGGLAEAITKAVGANDRRYLARWVDGYQNAIDELPLEAA